MRVTYVLLLDLPSTKAHTLQTVQSAAALARRGVEVHLHPRLERGAEPETILSRDFGLRVPPTLHLHPLPGRRADICRMALALTLLPVLIRGDRGHVILARERRAVLPLLALRRLTGRRARLVYEFHDLDHVLVRDDPRGGDPRRGRRILRQERRIAREADGLIATAEPLAREIEARLDPPVPVTVVPNGVDVSAFRGCGRPDLTGTSIRMVYAGSLYPEKGVQTLVDAMALLPERFRLTVVGGNTPSDLARLRERAGRIEDVASRIEFTGQVPVEEVPRQLARADILVIPAGRSAHSTRFTSPLKLYEALVSGIPLVVGPSAAFRSVVGPEDTAEIASGPGPRPLADAILRVADDPARAIRRARRAMAQADRHSWAMRGERLHVALRRALESRPPGSR